jgi:carboxylate-amine ligase
MAKKPNYTVSNEMVKNYLKQSGIRFNAKSIEEWDMTVGMEIELFLATVKDGRWRMLTNERARDNIIRKMRERMGKIFAEDPDLTCWLDNNGCFKFIDAEYWVCMIELGTPPSTTIAKQEYYYRTLMKNLVEIAGAEKVEFADGGESVVYPIAVSTPPNKQRGWRHSSKPRYRYLKQFVGKILNYFKIAGTQSQVFLPNEEVRIRHTLPAMTLAPLAIALTANSPIFMGEVQNKLACRGDKWRNFRDDIPEDLDVLSSRDNFEKHMLKLLDGVKEKAPGFLTQDDDGNELSLDQRLVNAASIFWSVVRPNQNHHTGEFRPAETTPYILDSILITAMYRALVRYIIRHPEYTMEDRFLLKSHIKAAEEKGMNATFYDAEGEGVSFDDALKDFLKMIQEDAEALGDWDFIQRQVKVIQRRGTAAEKLVALWGDNAPENSKSFEETAQAQQACMEWLIAETQQEATARCELS